MIRTSRRSSGARTIARLSMWLALVGAALLACVLVGAGVPSAAHAQAKKDDTKKDDGKKADPKAKDDGKKPDAKKGDPRKDEEAAAAAKAEEEKAAAAEAEEEKKAAAAKAKEDAQKKEKKDDDHDEEAHAGGSHIAFKAGAEISGYKDTDATNVLTPGISVGVEDELAGWGIDATFLVDVVTAASVDIVATSSPKWTDERFVPGIAGRFKAGEAVTLSAGGGASIESDYVAGSGTVGIAIDLANKSVTPSLSYTFGYDLAGRAGTPYSVYSKELMRHGAQLGVAFVVNKSTILVPTFTTALEFGDAAKPYRYLPTFVEGTELEPGVSIEEVNEKRTDVRLEEKVPDARYRFAGSLLLATRTGPLTFRIEERLYGDSWLLLATTTDILTPIDVTDVFRLTPHARFHAQKGVSFWNLAYVAEERPASLVVPGLRAGDRELGPMISGTLGLGFRVGSEEVGFSVAADAIYTRFLDHLYITDRLAGFAATTFDMKIQ